MSTGRQAPRPKRGGEEFARTHHYETSPKKPRFDIRNPSALAPDAPEEDAILDADEIGKRGQQTKRSAVNIDGYESDSSNEGFSARAEAKVTKKKPDANMSASKEEEEDDMFANPEEDRPGNGDQDEELKTGGKPKKKDVRFANAEKIEEGAEIQSKGGGQFNSTLLWKPKSEKGEDKTEAVFDYEADSSGESDVDDERRAAIDGEVDEEIGAGGKKKHAPKLDAFNLKAEKEDGGFDDQLNFVRKAVDPDAVHDSWLEGVSKKDMRRAKEAAEKREEERRKKALEADAVLTSDILKTLIPYLHRGETVLESLARFGKGKEKKQQKWKNRSKNKQEAQNGMNVDTEKSSESPEEAKRRHDVEAITGAADQLLTRGQMEIYDAERELLVRQYRRETGEEWIDPPTADPTDDVEHDDKEAERWEYRWSDARDGGEAHGPYDRTTMIAWNDAGYFGEGVEFRTVGAESDWRRSTDFV